MRLVPLHLATMFKKPLSNIKTSGMSSCISLESAGQSTAPLRSSDRRKLKQRVIQAYGISPELGDLLVPDGLMSQKVATYANDPGVSILVASRRNGRIGVHPSTHSFRSFIYRPKEILSGSPSARAQTILSLQVSLVSNIASGVTERY